MTRRILIVEDSKDMGELLQLHLEEHAYDVTLARDGRTGQHLALSEPYDLIVLDLMLPDMDGLEVCRRVRGQPTYVPILMLTSKSADVDRVVGLEMGADDYLVKPFVIRELIARIKALFRCVDAFAKPAAERLEQLRRGVMTIDVAKRKVTIGYGSVHLTAKEFDLLPQFARNPGRVYTRSQLLDLVWGYHNSAYEHTVNSHINRLRSKIESDQRNPTFIETVWGVGYRFSEAVPA